MAQNNYHTSYEAEIVDKDAPLYDNNDKYLGQVHIHNEYALGNHYTFKEKDITQYVTEKNGKYIYSTGTVRSEITETSQPFLNKNSILLLLIIVAIIIVVKKHKKK